MGPRACLLALTSAAAACSGGSVLLPALPHDGTIATEVLVRGVAGGAPEAHEVIDLRAGADALRFTLPDEPRHFEAFLLGPSVDALGVRVGRDTLNGGIAPADELRAVFAADVGTEQAVAWAEEAADPCATDAAAARGGGLAAATVAPAGATVARGLTARATAPPARGLTARHPSGLPPDVAARAAQRGALLGGGSALASIWSWSSLL